MRFEKTLSTSWASPETLARPRTVSSRTPLAVAVGRWGSGARWTTSARSRRWKWLSGPLSACGAYLPRSPLFAASPAARSPPRRSGRVRERATHLGFACVVQAAACAPDRVRRRSPGQAANWCLCKVTRRDMGDVAASVQIDAIIGKCDDWRGATLSQLRVVITQAEPAVVEEVKWKKPSRPEGVPVWSHDGIICVADLLKKAVRLTFPKGARMKDPGRLFNTRLDSKTVRAIDFFEDGTIDGSALAALIIEGGELNASR